jgi:hypothetical protein
MKMAIYKAMVLLAILILGLVLVGCLEASPTVQIQKDIESIQANQKARDALVAAEIGKLECSVFGLRAEINNMRASLEGQISRSAQNTDKSTVRIEINLGDGSGPVSTFNNIDDAIRYLSNFK